MYRKFIATIVAASIALTTFGSAPALADEDDVARALAAILGLAVVGKIIHDNKKDRRQVTRRYHDEPVYSAPERRVKPRPLPRRVKPHRVNRKLLPQQCFRSFQTRQGTYRAFGRRCLRNNYNFVNSLPQRCLYRFDTRRGQRSAYEARCLRNAGYRLARS